MYEIRVTSHFSAAHSLKNYKGKCESLHGHNWKVEVAVATAILEDCGMVMDFAELKKILTKVLDALDHKHLNDLDYFSAKGGSASGGKEHNTTSEEIAHYIFIKVKEKISKYGCHLRGVKVWETENSCASYHE